VVNFDDLRQYSVADLPGLIEGASTQNRGLGHKFLKHVERTKLLLLVVDVFGFQLGPKYPTRSAFETVLLLNKELEAHCDELVNRPTLLVCNKLDRLGGVDEYDRLKDCMSNFRGVCPTRGSRKRLTQFN
jgi:serine/threonine-protein kinase OSR1/STK39